MASHVSAATAIEAIDDGALTVVSEGNQRTFLEEIRQVTFSGEYATETGQSVTYVTERAVFELREAGLTLVEVAPGHDHQTDVIAHMGFESPVADSVQEMPRALFEAAPMDLTEHVR
jgi:propionate CoA-transferase